MSDNIYYNYNNLLSRNCMLNFVIGMRGGGKSYGAKRKMIKDFLSRGSQTVYVRRYKTELKKLNTFFSDIAHEFPDHKLEVKGRTFYCDGQVMGYAIALSTSALEKSNSYPLVSMIIFDEFLISTRGSQRYLPDEVTTFLDLFETIARKRSNVRAILIGNSITAINPYFTYLKVSPRADRIVTKDGLIAVEMYTNEKFKAEKLLTPFGRLVDGTEYGDYTLDNEFFEDSEVFVERRSKNSCFDFGFTYKGVTYGYWFDVSESKVYMSEKYDPSSRCIYALTTKDHQPNLLYIKGSVRPPQVQRLRKAYQLGVLRFETQEIKKVGEEILQLIY